MITGAKAGEDYSTSVAGRGDIQVYVVDEDGEVLTYAAHPNAAMATPTLEWEYAAGDFLLVVSDEPPLDATTARLSLSRYTGDGALSGAGNKPLTSALSGELEQTDRWVPFHGGHYDQQWTKPTGAKSAQEDVALYFYGDAEDTDWLSVVVVDSARRPLDEYVVEDGEVLFPLEAGESFVVTSQLPDEFGEYSFEWEVLPQPPKVSVSRAGSEPTADGGAYQVSWTLTTPHLTSVGNPSMTHHVEISADGKDWQTPAVESATGTSLSGSDVIRLRDGAWQIRVVAESDDYEVTSDPISYTADADPAGWQVTALHLDNREVEYYPGKQTGWRDFTDAVTVTETYRDGTTRTSHRNPRVEVQFRAKGSTQWTVMGRSSTTRLEYLFHQSGTVRLVLLGSSVVSEESPLTVVPRSGVYRATIAKPKASPTAGGAVVLKGTVWEKHADGSWQLLADGRWYQVQRKSGKKWVKVHSGQVGASGPGLIDETIAMAGSGTYRVTVEGKTVASWSLKLASPTKTAKITAPTITRHARSDGTTWTIGAATLTQKFSDGRWGPAKHGWTYTYQYRAVGTTKWRNVSKLSVHTPGSLTNYFRTPVGETEFRVVGTFKGKTYTSPLTRG